MKTGYVILAIIYSIFAVSTFNLLGLGFWGYFAIAATYFIMSDVVDTGLRWD